MFLSFSYLVFFIFLYFLFLLLHPFPTISSTNFSIFLREKSVEIVGQRVRRMEIKKRKLKTQKTKQLSRSRSHSLPSFYNKGLTGAPCFLLLFSLRRKHGLLKPLLYKDRNIRKKNRWHARSWSSFLSSLTFSNMVWITNPDVGEQRRRLDHDGMSGFSLVFEGP